MKTIQAAVAAAVLLAASGATRANVVFNFSFLAGTSVAAQQAFMDAGTRWSNALLDNVTLNMTVGTAALGAGILAETESSSVNYSYSTFRSALNTDRTSANDNAAVASLGAGSSFSMLINGTTDNPNGSGSATPYLDSAGANNQTINLTTANAKALGLASGTGRVGACAATCDASIVFGDTFPFDFNPLDGISAGVYDFVGIAAHEIGHALGFVSGVDVLDGNFGLFRADQFTFVSALDLFRYSNTSAAQGAIDFSADARDKFFSLDGGATALARFSTGEARGDGRQASHWKDSLGLGIMDPTASTGELLAINANDLRAFDVIGWNLAGTNPDPVPNPNPNPSVPEPSALALVALGLAGLAWSRRSKARPA
jgi:hypothetical protein